MDIQEIQAKINPLVGQNAWGVSLGYGSFITLEFGKSLLFSEEQQYIRGEWHLWVYCCAWRLEEDNKVLAACEDERNEIEEAIKRLEGLVLQSVVLLPPVWDAVFTFEHQVTLRLFSIYSKDNEAWMLFTPDGNVLSLGPGSHWTYESSKAIPTD